MSEIPHHVKLSVIQKLSDFCDDQIKSLQIKIKTEKEFLKYSNEIKTKAIIREYTKEIKCFETFKYNLFGLYDRLASGFSDDDDVTSKYLFFNESDPSPKKEITINPQINPEKNPEITIKSEIKPETTIKLKIKPEKKTNISPTNIITTNLFPFNKVKPLSLINPILNPRPNPFPDL